MSPVPAGPVVVRGEGLAGPTDADGAREWMQQPNDWSTQEHASWAVTDGSDTLLGSVSLHHLDLEQRDAEIGYWTSPDARGRGVAVGAVRLAVGWAFDELDLHRVYLDHAVENGPSCRVAAVAGFRQEGVLRESYRYADGDYHDEHLHAILASEWREMIAR